MTRVTISSITQRGVHPQFFGEFKYQHEVEDYEAMWRKLAAQTGIMVRIDRSPA